MHASTGDSLSTLFDLEAAKTEPLEREVVERGFGASWRGPVRLRVMQFSSHPWVGGTVRITAYLALPPFERPCPVLIHGSGDMGTAIGIARRHRIACLAFDRPGVGRSTGPEDTYANWIHYDDPREGWMWHYVTAAMRCVTLAQTLPEIDAKAVALTGSSRGGTMSFLAACADDRLAVAVPQASAGDIVAALDHGGWANYLHHDDTGATYVPGEFYSFAQVYDPILWAGLQRAPLMPIIGAQDEFFPLVTVRTTAEAFARLWLQIIPNWDHHYFTSDNAPVRAFDNRGEARRRTRGWIDAAIRCFLRRRAAMPAMPRLAMEGGLARLFAEGARRAVLYASFDGAYTFASEAMGGDEGGFVVDLGSGDMSGAICFAEADCGAGLRLSSLPYVGERFVQRMRPFPYGGG